MAVVYGHEDYEDWYPEYDSQYEPWDTMFYPKPLREGMTEEEYIDALEGIDDSAYEDRKWYLSTLERNG